MEASVPADVSDGPSPDPGALVDVLVSDVGDDVCFEISWNDGSVPPTSRCLELQPPISPIYLVREVNVSGEDMSEFVSVFVLVDPNMNVTRVTQYSEDVESQQMGRGLVVRGQSLLGAPTEVVYELDGVIGTCSWNRDEEIC